MSATRLLIISIIIASNLFPMPTNCMLQYLKVIRNIINPPVIVKHHIPYNATIKSGSGFLPLIAVLVATTCYMIKNDSTPLAMHLETALKECNQDEVQYTIDTLSGKNSQNTMYSALTTIAENNSDISKKLAPFVFKNLNEVLLSWHGCALIKKIIEKNPEEIETLFLSAINSSLEKKQYQLMWKLFLEILPRNPKAAQTLAITTLEKQFHPALFAQAMQTLSCDKTIEDHIKEQPSNHDFDLFLKTSIYCNYCNNHSFDEYNPQFDAPSFNHIKHEINTLINSPVIHNLHHASIRDMINQGLQKEKSLQRAGYDTFYHGRKRWHEIQEITFRSLYTTIKNIVVKKFIFTHIRPEETEVQEIEKRNSLLAGAEKFNAIQCLAINLGLMKLTDPVGVLFMNHFILGNLESWGNNSLIYALSNSNHMRVYNHTPLKNIFNWWNMDTVYAQYEKELLEIQEDYNKAGTFGQMLIIGIKKEKTDLCVYPTTNYGPKITVTIPEIGSTDKTSLILRHIDQIPDDTIQFGGLVTYDTGGLNHSEGVIIQTLDPTDHDLETRQKRIAAHKKRKMLFKKIKADIIAESQKRSRLPT